MHAVPLGAHAAAEPDERVVLHRLRQDEVPSGAEHPPDLGQDALGLLEVMQDVDAPDQGHRPVAQGEVGTVGYRGRRLVAGDRSPSRIA
ncbi:MAG: hypothetical protein M3179_13535, partial [Actinomycetota bacterium]|nr:hypothetical protein [Actinomycetota bacterium]